MRSTSSSSPERLHAMPVVPELGIPNGRRQSHDVFHVQMSDSRLDAVEHVVASNGCDGLPGAVFSGAHGTGKSVLGLMLATHAFLKGWPTVYIISSQCECLLV